VGLARGIVWVLENEERRRETAARARQKVVREFSLEKVAAQHMALYREMLEQKVSLSARYEGREHS
jgi:glycosyltransferase involved in cell wall biosynthesis